MFVFAGVCRSLITWLNSVATGISQVAFESSARRKISQWALWEGSTSTGRVSTLFNDIVLCSAAAMSTVHYFVGRVLMLVASLLTLLYYSPALTGVVLLLLVVATPLHRRLDKSITRASGTIQQSLSGVSDRLMRGVKNSIFLHIHGILGPEVSGQNRLIGNYERSSRQYYALASARGVLPQVLGILVVALIATQGSGVFSENKGDLVAYLYLVMRFFQTLSDTARVTANIRGNWPRLNILANWYRDDYSPGRSRMDRDTEAGHESVVRPDSVGFSLQDVSYSWSEGIYQRADAYIMTKYLDPCPNTVIEAMACGLPVLYSASGGVPEQVGPDAGVGMPVPESWDDVVHTPSPEAIGAGMVEIAGKAVSMGLAARRRAESEFEIVHWIERHRQIFQRLLESHN